MLLFGFYYESANRREFRGDRCSVAVEVKGSSVPESCRCAPHPWRRSTKSTYGSCVEVRFIAGGVQVRNSQHPDGPILTFTTEEWAAFLAGANEREFDSPGG